MSWFLRILPNRRKVAKPRRSSLWVRSLEDRLAPASFVVSVLGDGAGATLRNQILAANANGAGLDEITFDPVVFASATTITLSAGEIPISGSLDLLGPAAKLTISGNNSSRIFNINDGVAGNAIAVEIADLTLTKGTTSGAADGGAIFIQDEDVTLTRCTLTVNNSTSDGGAIRVEAAGGKLTLERSTLSNNTTAVSGGGISAINGPTVIINESTLDNNTGLSGGGLSMLNGGALTVTGSTFTSNDATSGDGGGMALNNAFTTCLVRNCTFSGNTASSDGGGIVLSNSSVGTLSVQNSTFASNNAIGDNGGAIARTGGTALISLISTIVFGNSAGTTADNLFTAGSVNATLCLIGNTTGVTTFNGDTFTDTNIGQNPGLGALANNGGPTQTRLPSAVGLAIDNGSNPGGVTTDQRGTGFFRVRGNAADIGAVELPDDFVVTNTNNSGAGSLRQAVLNANAAIGLDTIVFDATVFATAKTITLTTGELLVTETLTINGPAGALTVSGNNASRVFRAENASAVASLTIRDLTITAGKAGVGNDGGGILSTEPLTLQRVTVSNSSAGDEGGGIRITGAGSSLTLDSCTLSGNSATTGGGIATDSATTGSQKSSTISGNTATGFGGGVAVLASTSLSFTNCTLSGNTAATGGGIAWTVSGNNNTLNNCTLTGNAATGGQGGGLYAKTGTVNLNSTIASGNTGASSPDIFQSSGTTNVNFSAVGSSIGFTPTGANNLAFGTDLLLGPLQNNGGLTMTHAPAVNSPVLGKGNNGTGATTDQRGTGFPRVRGAVDIGAVEVNQFVVINTNANGAGSLLQAVLDANAAEGYDTITFDAAKFAATETIIPSAEMFVTEELDIQGPSAQVIVSGNAVRRIFQVTGGDTFHFSNLRLLLGSAASSGGALVLNSPAAVATFTNCVLSFNQSSNAGGAISAINGSFNLIDCTLSNNSAPAGGAIILGGLGHLSLTRTTVSNNTTSAATGGGITVQGIGASMLILDSTIANNESKNSGGGIAIFEAPGALGHVIRNSTISGNTSSVNGGGIFWGTSGGTLTIQNSTITNNTSTTGLGGGISLTAGGAGTLDLESAIISGNFNFNSTAPDIYNPNTTNQKTSAVGAAPGFTKTDLGGNLPFQPHANLKLGVLAGNGGPTPTHLPQFGSPLLNVGSNPAVLATDQRGFPRAMGGALDIGAAEFLNTEVKNTNNSGVDSLRQIILDTNAAPGAQTITFSPTVFASAQTIKLSSGQLDITDDLTITGPSIGVAISGDNSSRVMKIGAAVNLTVNLSNLTIRDGNVTGFDNGAGILSGDDTLTLTNCIVTDNHSSETGGGIMVSAGLDDAKLTLMNSQVSGNTADNGGGIAVAGAIFTIHIENSTIYDNEATVDGGGIWLINTGTLTVLNSTLSGNSAAGDGGAIFMLSAGQTLAVRNSTIADNSAIGSGGGIYRNIDHFTDFESSIVFGNTAFSAPDMFSPGTVKAISSLFGSTSGVATFTGDAFTNANIGVDPLLGPLQNNGGTTLTHLPAFNSKAVNNGTNPAALTNDQRGSGFPRSFGGGVDIGAVEVHTFTVTNTSNSGAGSLRQAVLDANATPGTDQIIFDPTVFATAKTITLTSGELDISGSTYVIGPNAGVTVSGNNASRVFVASKSADFVSISNMTLTGGKVASGSGSAILTGTPSLTLTNCVITGNQVTGGSGGGAISSVVSNTSVNLDGCTVANNSSTGDGGGISLANFDHSLTILNSTIFGNSAAGKGGGAYVAGIAIIRNSTISGNTAATDGGGLHVTFGATLEIQNSTIVNNTATAGIGGGVVAAAGADVKVESSIIFGNTATANPDIKNGKFNVTVSLLGNTAGATSFTGDAFTNSKIGVDPQLGPLTNNGGSMLTHMPANSSPAFNTGSNSAGLTTDQRGSGFPRVIGGLIDIGAVEIRNLVVINTNDSGAGSLRQTVLEANALSGPDTITFDPIVFATADTITLTSGEMVISDHVVIDGPTARPTVSGNNASRIFSLVSGSPLTVGLFDLVLTQGKSLANGGAIDASGDELTLTRCDVTNSTANFSGGGVANLGGASSFTALDCLFSGNSAGLSGNAIAVSASSGQNASTKLQRTVVTGNTGIGIGAVSAAGGSGAAGGYFLVLDSTVANNTSTLVVGGLSISGNNKSATIRNSTLSNNTSPQKGAAVNVSSSFDGPFLVQNSTITQNQTTTSGTGGIFRESSATGTFVIESSIVSGNTGAGLFNDDVSSYGAASVAIQNSIVGAGIVNAVFDTFSKNTQGVDPLLGPLQNNGGAMLTHQPAFNSVAVNNGTNLSGLTNDQRGAGFPRNFMGGVDIGAVESRVIIVQNINNSGAGSLRQAITDANLAPGPDTITFSPSVFASSQTITLTTGLLNIADHLLIIGPGVGVTISGNNASQIFTVNDSTSSTITASLSNLILTAGKATSFSAVSVGVTDEVTLTNCVVTGNQSTSATIGGAIGTSAFNAKITLIGCSVTGNTAVSNGGGIAANNTSTIVIQDSLIANNTAGTTGGGIHGVSALTIVNSTISGNVAATGGGGVNLTSSSVPFTVRNSTIVNNSTASGVGGGLARPTSTTTPITLESTIVFGNSAPTGPDVSAKNVNATASLVGNNAGVTTFTGDAFTNANVGVDPQLGALTNNGGPTNTHLPALTSIAIDNGTNSLAFGNDQRGTGFPRQIGFGVDIGATELRAFIVHNTNDAGPGSLRQAVLDSNAMAGPDTIAFDPTVFTSNKTITLTSGELAISDGVTLSGPSVGVTVSGNNATRIWNIQGTGGQTVTFANMTLTQGNVTIPFGGAAITAKQVTLNLLNCQVTDNASLVTPGVAIESGVLTVEDSSFINNVGTSGSGAGTIALFGSGSGLSLRRSTISGNSVAFGGGLYVTLSSGGPALLIEDSTISGNKATTGFGGALYLKGSFVTGQAVIRNSTISSNQADDNGGAIFHNGGGILQLFNSTIVNNSSAEDGGGVSLGNINSKVALESTILFGNTAKNGPNLHGSSTVTANASLIGSKTGFAGTLTTDKFTNDNIGVDPVLGSLQDNGGPTFTHLPALISKAVNNGANPAALTTDQRGTGFPRVIGGAIDIGAVETRSFIVSNDNDAGAGSLRQAVVDTNALAGSDTIIFDPTFFATAKTISLLSALPAFSDGVSIQGTGSALLTVRRDAAAVTDYRVFSFLTGAGKLSSISAMTITGGKFNGGGAILITTSALTLDRVVVTGNTSTASGGGILAISSDLTVIDTTISNNFAGSSDGHNGGGIASINSNLTILNSTLSGNSAVNGGGVLASGSIGSLSITNSTISGNSALIAGGLDINTFNGSPIRIRNSTITGNTGPNGPGGVRVVNSGAVEIESTIVSGNTGGANDDIGGSSISLKSSLIGSTVAFTFTDLGGNLIGVNPLLGPLANNGGSTQTHALLPGSQLINSGSNPALLTTDQRGVGFDRVNGGTIDIGAFESQLAPTVRNVIVNDGSAQRSKVTSVTVLFDNVVNFSGAPVDAFQLKRQSDNALPLLSAAVTNGATTSVTLTFLAGPAVEFGSLADGKYTLTIDNTKISANGAQLDGNVDGVGGDNFVVVGSPATAPKLYRLFGDGNGDGTVNAADFNLFRLVYGQTGPSIFDFDGDNQVTAADFNHFRLRFGITLVP